jgi:peptidase S41-like protein
MRPLALSASALAAALLCLSAPACAQDAHFTAQQARDDLDQLYHGLRSAAADLYSQTPETVFDARYQELRASYDAPVTPHALFTDFQRFAALARQSHNRLEGLSPGFPAFYSQGGPIFPLRFQVAHGEVIVSAAPQGSAIRPGDRLVALNGEPNPIWLQRLKQHVSADTPALAYSMISQGEFYYVWLEYGVRDSFTVAFERDGTTRSETLAAIPADAMWELEEIEPGFSLAGRDAQMLNETTAYLRPGAFFDVDAATPDEAYAPAAVQRFTGFIDAAFERFIEAGATDLVLDLRDNPGGDIVFSDPVIAWFADRPFRFASDFRVRVSEETAASMQARIDANPDGGQEISRELIDLFANSQPGDLISYDLPYAQPRQGQQFTGNVHVLVNRNSFSNAVTTAALIQDYGFGTVYGETTRDMATTFGAMEHFTLSNTGFRVGYAKALIIRPNGREDTHPVMPDITLPAPAVRGTDDVMLQALLARLAAN